MCLFCSRYIILPCANKFLNSPFKARKELDKKQSIFLCLKIKAWQPTPAILICLGWTYIQACIISFGHSYMIVILYKNTCPCKFYTFISLCWTVYTQGFYNDSVDMPAGSLSLDNTLIIVSPSQQLFSSFENNVSICKKWDRIQG